MTFTIPDLAPGRDRPREKTPEPRCTAATSRAQLPGTGAVPLTYAPPAPAYLGDGVSALSSPVLGTSIQPGGGLGGLCGTLATPHDHGAAKRALSPDAIIGHALSPSNGRVNWPTAWTA